MRLRNPEDFWSGLMFTIAGLAFAIGATNYSFGQSARPGPGYFPFGLGLLLAVLGVAILMKSWFGERDEDDGRNELPIAWRPLGIVVAAIVLFGLALPRFGLALTLPLLIAVISRAGDQFRWREVLLNSAILTVGSWAVFIKGLQLTIPLWPTWIH
jgi:hypothetical protein